MGEEADTLNLSSVYQHEDAPHPSALADKSSSLVNSALPVASITCKHSDQPEIKRVGFIYIRKFVETEEMDVLSITPTSNAGYLVVVLASFCGSVVENPYTPLLSGGDDGLWR